MEATVGAPIFGALRPAHAAKLRAASRIVAVAEGQTIFVPGQECTDFLIVRSGTVRVEMLSVNGDATLLYRLHPGDACVLTMAALLAHAAIAPSRSPKARSRRSP